MIIVCEECGKKGTIDERSYSGKTLKLRCPYCSYHFLFLVPRDGHSTGAVETPSGLETGGVESPENRLSLRSEEEAASEALILEAKRIARLIVSEIKLYNHERIQKVRSKREVLELLRAELMRGKQHYNSRIAGKLPMGPDYFMETVKEILLADKD